MKHLAGRHFVIDVGYHKIVVAEARSWAFLIGVVDSNHSRGCGLCDPRQ